MSTTKTVAMLIGNPRPAGRTSQVAAAVASVVAQGLGDADVLAPVELGVHGAAVLDPDSSAVDRDRHVVAAADVVIVTSPTYKATYTGLLKSFLDRYDSSGLSGVTAIPVMVGGSAHHALAVDVHLRPLLVELDAVLPSRGLYVLDSEMDRLDHIVAKWWEANGSGIRAAVQARGVA